MAKKVIWSINAQKDRTSIFSYWNNRNKYILTMSAVRLSLFSSFLLLLVACNPRGNNSHIPKDQDAITLNNFINQPGLENASIGILVVDANSGEKVIAHNSATSLVPASTLKIVTSASALETFGPKHTFKTLLAYTGKISEARTLNGDLVLLGSGDPAFMSMLFKDHYGNVFKNMLQEIRGAGIRWINGNVVGDASYFGQQQIPDTWIWEDIGNYYGSSAYGLNIYDNTYTITFRTEEAGSQAQITKIEPDLPWLKFENHVTAANNGGDNAYIYGSYFSDKRIIKGTIPKNRKSFSIKGSIPDPAFLAANQLLSKIKENGVGVSGNATSNYSEEKISNHQHLLEIKSPPLSEIIYQLNMKSINLYAETLLLHLAKTKGRNCTTEEGCKTLSTFWKNKGMDISGLYLEDGSGLSRANAVTAKQLVFVLQYMKTESKYSKSFLRSLPVAGKSERLKDFGLETELVGKLRAKSGYMSRVMGYAGYLTTESGSELAFAIIVNNYNCTNAEMRKMLEHFLSDLGR